MNPLYKAFFCLYENSEKKKRKENEKSLHPWYDWALGELGQKEIPGSKHNERIVWYGKFVSLDISDDETAWCSCFVNAAMQYAGGFKGTKSATARSWLNWDEGYPVKLADARVSDIAILQRGNSSWQGHVAFVAKKYDGSGFLELLGGNQQNSVSIAKYSVNKLLGIRRPRV